MPPARTTTSKQQQHHPQQPQQEPDVPPWPTRFTLYLILASLLRLILILWSFYQDRTPFKYTDVDYNVFTDAARCLVHPNSTDCHPSQGPFSHLLPFQIGDPYARDTYRYTPLVAIITAPNILLHPATAKVFFSLADLAVGILLFRLLQTRRVAPLSASNIVASVWLLNPIIANISTRGSAESILGLLVVGVLFLAEKQRWDSAAVAFGLAVHFKIFPVIYGSSLLAALGGGKTWVGVPIPTRAHVRFGILSFGSFMGLNLVMYSIWGYPFLDHTFLYHISRLDHRHNFSPYFYAYYLSEFFPPSPSSSSLMSILQHPLGAFIPQIGLATILGFAFGKRDLSFAWLVQTFAFVTFNKVCTSQYFLWYLWLLPPVLPRLQLSPRRGGLLIFVWVASQALWLSQAYRLEMLAQPVFLEVWAAGWLFLASNCWLLAQLIDAYQMPPPSIAGTEKLKKN